MREATYVLSLAWKRVRRRSSGALLAASGIAVGTAVLVGVLAGTKVAQDRSASQAVERIPAVARSVRAVWFGVPVSTTESQPALDRAVRTELDGLGLPGPTAIALFRESTVAGHFVAIAGVDGLASHVQLKTGRLPHRCTPARCEVLRLRGTGQLPNAPGLRLVQVGTGSLRSRQLFGDFSADRQRPRRPGDLALDSAGGLVSPPAAGAARRRGRNRAAHGRARALAHLPQLCVGVAAAGRRAATVADRRPRRAHGPRARCALRQVDRVQRAGAAGGAACRRTRRDRGGAPAPPRRRRGGSVALRVRRARGSDDAARPAGGPPQAHLVRGAGLAARPVDGNRELCRRGHRYARRLGHRSCGRGDRGFDCRSAGRHRSARERAVPGRARARGRRSRYRVPRHLGRSLDRNARGPAFRCDRRRGRGSGRDRPRSASRRRRGRVAPRERAGRRPPAAPVTRADLVCRRRRGRSCLRPARQACRAAGPWSCRHEARCRHARARAGSGGCHSGVSRPRVCSGAPRRGLQGDARAGEKRIRRRFRCRSTSSCGRT